MPINCQVLGKDVPITEATFPVISPFWRLKRSGDWSLLCKYEQEQINYSILPPLVGATLSLMDGRLSFRHLSLIVQYAHDFESLDQSEEFVSRVIMSANKDNDAIVNMDDEIAPYIKKCDPLEFVVAPAEGSEQRRPAAPISLNLMFSNDCETNCVYCYAHRRPVAADRQLPTSRWIEIFREARSLGMEQITLSGGDPLSGKNALALIAELIDLEMLFLLSTKCHITAEIADRLVEIGMNEPVNQYVREIQLSMDGPDEQTADRLAGSPGYYRRAIDSIKNLVARGFNLRVKSVVTPLNAPRVYEWIKQVAELGVTQLSVAAYNRTLHRHDDRLFLRREDRLLIAQQCERARKEFPGIDLRMTGLEREPLSEEPVPPGALDGAQAPAAAQAGVGDKAKLWQERAQCSGGRSSMTITPDGKVVLCDTIPQEGIFVVGDVSEHSIVEVWNSQPLLELAYPPREKFAGSACYQCEEFEACQKKAGYCFRDSYFNYGSAFAPPPKCPLAPDDGMRME